MAGGLGLLARRRRAGRRPGPAEEPDDRAVLGVARRVGQLGQDGGRERRLAELEDPPSAPPPASGPDPPETGGIIATSSPSASAVAGLGVVAVAGEPHRRAAGRQDRVARDERGPGGLDVGAVGELERDLARPGQLALDREQADPDAHGRRRHRRQLSRATCAMSSPSPSGRIVGREARIGEDRRVERAQRGRVRVVGRGRPGARDPAAPQDVVGDDQRAGREPRRRAPRGRPRTRA